MKGYCKNSISCGENRKKMEDQSVIKGKLKTKRQNISSGLSFLGKLIRVEEEKRRRIGKRRISQERYGFLYTSMDVLILYGI